MLQERDEIFEDTQDDADGYIRCGIINHDYQKKEIEKQLKEKRKKIPQNVLPMVLMIAEPTAAAVAMAPKTPTTAKSAMMATPTQMMAVRPLAPKKRVGIAR